MPELFWQLILGVDQAIFPKRIWPLALGIAALIFVSILLIWTLGRLRRYLQSPSMPPTAGPGWTLGQLRKLHEQGELTDEQYQHLRDDLLEGQKKGQ